MTIKTPGREIFRKYTSEETFAKIKEYGTVQEMWNAHLEEYKDVASISDDGQQYTYARLDEDMAGFRSILSGLAGMEDSCKGKRIGIYSPNCYDFVKAYMAVVTSGAVAVILPPQLDEMTVFGCAMKFGLSALVYSPALEGKLEILKAKAPQVAIVSCADYSNEKKQMTQNSPSDPCIIMFTGGTTGKSKGAMLSHEAVMQGTVNGCYGYQDVFFQKYLLVLPFSHVFGLIRNLMTCLYTGGSLMICRNNQDMFRDIAMFKPTILVAVPALVEMSLALSGKFGKNMLGEELKYIICGAAAVSPYLVKGCADYGITLFPGYGLTESANLVSGNPESALKSDSVGIPFPNQEFRIENGELWIKGKNMMSGYIGEDESPYEDGWFKTGDLVRMDEEGFLYITGRIKELIILSNGENVSPAAVEAVFNELSFVQDSQVFEDIAENGQHILALEIVPRAAAVAAMQAEDKKEYMLSELSRVNLTLPGYERVSRMEIRTQDFERTPSMKIVRYKKCQ